MSDLFALLDRLWPWYRRVLDNRLGAPRLALAVTRYARCALTLGESLCKTLNCEGAEKGSNTAPGARGRPSEQAHHDAAVCEARAFRRELNRQDAEDEYALLSEAETEKIVKEIAP